MAKKKNKFLNQIRENITPETKKKVEDSLPTIEETKEYVELIVNPLQEALDSFKLRNLSKKGNGITLYLERDGVEVNFIMRRKKVLKK
jgi:hypothetical protein